MDKKRMLGTLPNFAHLFLGKTVTIVEAMKQVLKLSPGCKILAAAPSNAAADLLAERLKEHIARNMTDNIDHYSIKTK